MQALQGAGRTLSTGASSDGGVPTLGRGVKAPPAQKVDAALEALRQAFAKRGCDSLLRLGKKFAILDDDQSHQLTYEEVRLLALRSCLIVLFQNSHEIEEIIASAMGRCCWYGIVPEY
jgi:hypothetical protein